MEKIMSNQNVIDAWANMKPWVEGTLPALVKKQPLPDAQEKVSATDACSIYNQGGGDNGSSWGADGEATVNLSSLRVSAFDGVTIQPASFTDPTTVQLPISFSSLAVQGQFSYVQPCALWDAGKKTSTSSSKGDGSLSQTIANNTICYRAKFDGVLSLLDVAVNGTPAVQVKANVGYWSNNLAAQVQNGVAKDLASSLNNIFACSDFSKELINFLNAQLSQAVGQNQKQVDLYLLGQEHQEPFVSFALEQGRLHGIDRYGTKHTGCYEFAADGSLNLNLAGKAKLPSWHLTCRQLSGEEAVAVDLTDVGTVHVRLRMR